MSTLYTKKRDFLKDNLRDQIILCITLFITLKNCAKDKLEIVRTMTCAVLVFGNFSMTDHCNTIFRLMQKKLFVD